MTASENQITIMKKKGYCHIGEGYLHNVYEKDGLIFKGLKTPCLLDQYHKFEHEKAVMDFLRENGIPTVRVIDILREGIILEDICFLVEEKANGKNYKKEEMPEELKKLFFSFIMRIASLRAPFWGDTKPKEGEKGKTWIEFLESYIKGMDELSQEEREGHSEAELKQWIEDNLMDVEIPAFLIMDTNPQNFFWDDRGNICSVIDIDHPVFGDPLFQIASARIEWGEEAKQYLKISEEAEERVQFYIMILRLKDLMLRKKFFGEGEKNVYDFM